jgi:tRNA A-37 threonylcarbamoyl transferase component Bud32
VEAPFETSHAGDLRIAHAPGVPPAAVSQAIALHRENFARGRAACLHWGPGSSVSRVRIGGDAAALDLAVKWNPWRGWRRALSDWLHGSRARRALAASRRLAPTGLLQPEVLAVAERCRFGVVRESFLLTRFLEGADPLPIAMARLVDARTPRRALLRALGEAIGRLHAQGFDHRDSKHSNLLVDPSGRIVFLDLEAVHRLPPRSLRRRARALGSLEAFARDLYPWLPARERICFLRAYLHAQPGLTGRGALVRHVRRAAERRLARWAGRESERRAERHFPLVPRDAGACRDDGAPRARGDERAPGDAPRAAAADGCPGPGSMQCSTEPGSSPARSASRWNWSEPTRSSDSAPARPQKRSNPPTAG